MTVFLSPSSKKYIVSQLRDKSEAEYMDELTKVIEKELKTSGIDVYRSDTDATPTESVRRSNENNVDFHLSFSCLGRSDTTERGIKIYYPSNDGRSRDRARSFSENLKRIYPLPEKVEAVSNCSFIELTQTNAPSILIAICNINNQSDEKWFEENLENLAVEIKRSIN